MIEIKSAEDLVQLSGSIIRNLQVLNNPARILIAIDGPDEMRYILTVTPNYSLQSTPVAATITTGINLNVSQDKE